MEDWEKLPKVEVIEIIPRESPPSKRELLAKNITDHHNKREDISPETPKKIQLEEGEFATPVQGGVDTYKERGVLEEERARILAQLVDYYNNLGNKSKGSLEITDLEARLKDIEGELEKSVSEEPKEGKGISVSERKNFELLTQEEAEALYPAESPIDENTEYVSIGKGVVKQVNPSHFIKISMGDFEGTVIGRDNIRKVEAIETKKLNDARKRLAFADPKKDIDIYAQARQEYLICVDEQKDFIIKNKKLTLEKKGLNPEQVQFELDKYTKEVIAPHFSVVEAAKIQEARTEPSFVEKMKGSRYGNLAANVIDGYRKMPWQKKVLVSVGLFGVGVAAGAGGGTLGLAVAGIVTGGKGIQRLLSGAGTAVGLDAWMQRSQQKWMDKEGWGKNRHEYISKQISLMREKIKSGDGSGQDIERSLEERARIERRNEMKRTGLAAIAGVLVGSGTAFRVADEYLGISDKLRTAGEYWGDKLGHLFGGHTEAPIRVPTMETIAPVKIEPIKLSIGTRGPEGAIIDEIRNNPDLAKKFGWLGGSNEDLSKWAGAKAHILWEENANQALLDPSVKQELAKFGYPETIDGYERAMTRIGKGVVYLNVDKGSITLNAEYLKNVISSPHHMIGGMVEAPIHETPPLQHPEVASPSVPPIDLVEIQRQMDLPEGKLRGILINSGVRSSAIEDLLKREGGMEKLLKMPVRELYGIEQGYPRPVQLDRLYEGLKGITGEARLDSNDTLEDVLKSIDSKKIFHGTAEEILKDEIPHPLTVIEPAHSGIVEEATKEHTEVSHEAITAKSSEIKISDVAKEAGQISPHEVVTKTGIKGVFDYDASGKIKDMKISGSGSTLQGRSLLQDNYEEVMKKKGAKLMDLRAVKVNAQNLFNQEQLLKTLEDSGQGSGDKAEFLRKAIKNATNQLENKFGKIFK